MNRIGWEKRVLKWLIYKILARHRRGHGLHSPFLYHLAVEVLNKKEGPKDLDQLRKLRKEWIESPKQFTYNDPGEGEGIERNRKLSYLVKIASTPEKFGKLLYRLVKRFKPDVVLEVGTCVGHGTLYLSADNLAGKVITLEGVSGLVEVAKEGFQKMGRTNINVLEGRFEDTLPAVLEKEKKLDLVFFDGNHTQEATLTYFDLCRAKAHSDTLFIFDDIHLTDGMENAWNNIKKSSDVSLTVDLFRMGLVFFNEGLSKQDVVIRF